MPEPKNQDLWNAVLSIDLEPIRRRVLASGAIADRDAESIAGIGVRDYREYLYMLVAHRDKTIVPTRLIDLFWHEHIVDTRKYKDDCRIIHNGLPHEPGRAFNNFIDHDPGVVPGTVRFDEGVRNRTRYFIQYTGGLPSSWGDRSASCDSGNCA